MVLDDWFFLCFLWGGNGRSTEVCSLLDRFLLYCCCFIYDFFSLLLFFFSSPLPLPSLLPQNRTFKNDPRVASHVVMVSPDHFQFNPDAAESNVFANNPSNESNTKEEERSLVLAEFEKMVNTLRGAGIEATVLPSPGPDAPDAVFPNNWFTTHRCADGKAKVVLYPMLNPNRMVEKRNLPELKGAIVKNDEATDVEVWDSSAKFEEKSMAVEGTGVLIFDHFGVSLKDKETSFPRCFCVGNGPRADPEAVRFILGESGVMKKQEEGEEPFVFFDSVDEKGVPIYHTNVMMAIGSDFAVVCEESITNSQELETVRKHLLSSSLSREIINISYAQVKNMCGNVLELKNQEGELFVLMSGTAFKAFTDKQLAVLRNGGRKILSVEIPTIERVGGGSARCMVAEIF